MTTLETLLKQVEELDAKGRESQTHSEYECIVWELARATPILVEVIRKVMEQRDRWAEWYIESRNGRLDELTERNKDNAELDAIVAKRLGEGN